MRHAQRRAPAGAPTLALSLSSDILPEYREYERTATTVINAYVQPLVARYLQRLEQSLPSSTNQLRIMQSNGGAIGLHQAAEQAARLVLSGPAGGVVGAFEIARLKPITAATPELAALNAEHAAIEERIAALRLRREELGDDYLPQLQALLVELARVQERIDAAERP